MSAQAPSPTAAMSNLVTGDSGQFEWFRSIGATEEAVKVLNDQPILFTILIVVIVSLIVMSLLIWFIDFATKKPEQKKKKDANKGGKGGALKTFFPPALRRRF